VGGPYFDDIFRLFSRCAMSSKQDPCPKFRGKDLGLATGKLVFPTLGFYEKYVL